MTKYNKSWTEEQIDKLAFMYCVEGRDIEDIAHRLDKTPIAVQTQLRIHSLVLTPQGVAARRVRGIVRGRPRRQHA